MKTQIEKKTESIINAWMAGEYDKADEFLTEAQALKDKLPASNIALHKKLDDVMEQAIEILDQMGQQILKEREAGQQESRSVNSVQLASGDVIVEPYGLTAIVMKECNPPDDSWFIRANEAYRGLASKKQNMRWFEAMVLSGGAIVVAEPLCTFLRKATEDDAKSAHHHANAAGKESLTALFLYLRNP